jgi:hypothetical protein
MVSEIETRFWMKGNILNPDTKDMEVRIYEQVPFLYLRMIANTDDLVL